MPVKYIMIQYFLAFPLFINSINIINSTNTINSINTVNSTNTISIIHTINTLSVQQQCTVTGKQTGRD